MNIWFNENIIRIVETHEDGISKKTIYATKLSQIEIQQPLVSTFVKQTRNTKI